MIISDWFDCDVKPVRRGVYQVRSPTGQILYSRWDGKKWFFMGDTPTEAKQAEMWSFNQYKTWRGILKSQGCDSSFFIEGYRAYRFGAAYVCPYSGPRLHDEWTDGWGAAEADLKANRTWRY